MRRKFSRPPVPGAKARPSKKTVRGELPPVISEFRSRYIFERNILRKFRDGAEASYTPSPSLDGKPKWDTPEVKTSSGSAWRSAYSKLLNSDLGISPTRYVGILFRILRGSSLAEPTVAQLASPRMLGLVREYMPDRVKDIRQQLVAESQRLEEHISLKMKVSGQPLGLAVYYAVTDTRLGLSPLFQYCVVHETLGKMDPEKDKGHFERLVKVADRVALLAAMEYTLFPDAYDEVWGSLIPEEFRVTAARRVAEAIERQVS